MLSRYFKLFFWALTISFLGSLPIGTLNVTVTSLVINKGIIQAVEFALGAILVEIVLVRIAIAAVKKSEGLKRLNKFFSALTCIVLFLFAWISFRAAFETHKFETVLPFTSQRPFLSGVFLSLINPLHLPFWLGWTAVLKSKKIFWDSKSTYNIYVIGIGVGTSIAFFTYAILGNFLIDFLKEKQTLLNWIIGIALLVTCLLQFYKSFIKEKINSSAQTEMEYN
jgi:threonine/homoserine/homoserine lactone efflux protein